MVGGNPFAPPKPPALGGAPKKKATPVGGVKKKTSGSKPSAANRAKAQATSRTRPKTGSGKPPRM